MSLIKNGRGQRRAFTGIMSIILLAVMISSVLSGCYFFPKEEEVLAPPIKEPEKVTYETIEVKKGTIEDTIRCTGTFVSVSQEDVSYKERGGRIQELFVVLGDEVKKGDVLAQLETDTIKNDIQLQEIALKRAKLVYDSAKTRYDIEGGSKMDLEVAELDLQYNQIKLDGLNNELAKTKLVAPIDGEVVYITDTNLGDIVNARQTIVRIADPSKLQLRYSEDQVSSFRVGMIADVEIGGDKCEGEVVMTPGNLPADADEEAKKSIMINIKNLSPEVSIGQTATIMLTLEKHENVIVLPKQVINSYSSRKFVNVLSNNLREERDVEIGIQNSTEVEVIKGLEEGELVIVR